MLRSKVAASGVPVQKGSVDAPTVEPLVAGAGAAGCATVPALEPARRRVSAT